MTTSQENKENDTEKTGISIERNPLPKDQRYEEPTYMDKTSTTAAEALHGDAWPQTGSRPLHEEKIEKSESKAQATTEYIEVTEATGADGDRPMDAAAPKSKTAWSSFLQSAQDYDAEKIDIWKAEMDNLLVFAGLFSAVVTTFVSGSLQSLQQDVAQTSADILAQISLQLSSPSTAPAPAPSSTPFEPDPNDVVVNMLWVLSLTLSLVAAFFAIAVQQWLRAFPLPRSLSVQDAVRLRHSRFSGLIRWQVPDVITLLPVLLQVAVVFFLVGLYLLLRKINHPISIAYAVISGLPFFLYAITLFLPLIDPSCPFKSPLVPSALWLSNVTLSLAAIVFRAISAFVTLVVFPMTTFALLIPVGVGLMAIGLTIGVAAGSITLPIFATTKLITVLRSLLSRRARPSALSPDFASVTYSNHTTPALPVTSVPIPDTNIGAGDVDTDSANRFVYSRALRLKVLLKSLPRIVVLFIFKISGGRRTTIPVPITKEEFWTDREVRRLPRADSSDAMPDYLDALAWAPHAIQFYSLKDVEPCLRTLSQSSRSACIVAWAALYLGNHHIDSVAVLRQKRIWTLPSLRLIRHWVPIKPSLVVKVNRAFAEEFKGYLADNLQEALISPCGAYSDLPSLSGILILATQLVINRAEPGFHLTLVPALVRLFESESFNQESDMSSHYPAVCLFRCCTLASSDERYLFTAQETCHLMNIFGLHMSAIADMPRWRLEQMINDSVLQEVVLASAATICIALTQQTQEVLESDSNPLSTHVPNFLSALRWFAMNAHRRIRDVGLLYLQLGSGQDSFIVTPAAVTSIAESLLQIHQGVSLPAADRTLALAEVLLELCTGERAFEKAIQPLRSLLLVLQRPRSPLPPTSSVMPDDAKRQGSTTPERPSRVSQLLGLSKLPHPRSDEEAYSVKGDL